MNCDKTMVFLEECRRLCEANDCQGCPIEIYCPTQYKLTKPLELIEAVQTWSDAHPLVTRLSLFLEKFPNALLHSEGYPKACAGAVYGFDYEHCLRNGYECMMCWNTSIEDSSHEK